VLVVALPPFRLIAAGLSRAATRVVGVFERGETERLPADAGRFMPLKILKYDIVRDAARSTKVAASPGMASLVPLT
jgi:hypothetical protein